VRIVGTIAETSTPGHGGPGQAIRVTKITHLG